MKKILFALTLCLSCFDLLYAQTDKDGKPLTAEEGQQLMKQFDSTKFLKNAADDACKCIDSISVRNKGQKEIAPEIKQCIDKQVVAYELAMKLFGSLRNPSKSITISINDDPSSSDYKRYYYDLERRLRDSCPSLKTAVNSNNIERNFSISNNPKAMDAYNQGIVYFNKEDFKTALPYFKKAVEIDGNFAFAWDNLGLCYRKTNDYDNAIDAYKNSLEADPKGQTALQNIAIAYEFKKEYDKELDAYKHLAALYPDDPETFYGIGRVYIFFKTDMEKGLDYMCKAYNLYVKMNSPYRTDAEKNIQAIYQQMKKDNKEDVFDKILKDNNISPGK